MIERSLTTLPLRTSPWLATARLPERAPLLRDVSVDACVIGAGIAGLSTAYLLAREGRSVVVVDDGPVAGGMTSATSAHLTSALDDRYFEIERSRGDDAARLAADSHQQAIERIQAVVRDEAIDCSFSRVDGYLFLSEGDEEKTLDRELESARRAGLQVEKLRRAPKAPFDTGPCLRFPRQGQFHPVQYLAGLLQAIERRGGVVHTSTKALDVKDGRPCSVTTNRGIVTAETVIIATNVPIKGRVVIPIREAAYMTHVLGARIPRGSVPPALLWDTGFPYHYVRMASLDGLPGSDTEGQHDLLIAGGEDHRSAHDSGPHDHHSKLEQWARRRFPMMGEVEFVWSGQVVETMDGLAFIGRNPGDEHVYVASGDSGMGLTHGTIAGMLLTDLACGRENPWAALYDPSRAGITNAWTLLKENASTGARYAEWLRGGDVKTEEAIPRGAGAVLRHGVKPVACYRDAGGKLHRMSAICPHMGCIVHWNPDATTWDCPCHGSRFNPTGTVVNGPANSDLPPVGGG